MTSTEQVLEFHDPVVGALVLEVRPGRRVRLSGERVPEVVVERVGQGGYGGQDAAHAPPIGTREAARLRASIGGRELVLHPRPGRLARGSFAVGVTGPDGQTWVLAPASPYSSRLVRGRTRSRRRQVGELTRGADGGVGARWSRERLPTPAEVALGYALAESFDTGAALTWVEVLLGGSGVGGSA